MKIGQIEIPQLCRLAPMAAISNAPFRLIAKEYGSGLTTTEEMDAFALLMDTRLAGDVAAYYPQERPLAMQLLGRDPQALIRAAHRCQELGADIVDLNVGCPMPKITGKGKPVPTLAFAPGEASSPGSQAGDPQERPHVARPHRAAREPREQRLSVYAPSSPCALVVCKRQWVPLTASCLSTS